MGDILATRQRGGLASIVKTATKGLKGCSEYLKTQVGYRDCTYVLYLYSGEQMLALMLDNGCSSAKKEKRYVAIIISGNLN